MSDQQLTINISTGALIKVVTFVLVAWLLYLVRDILLLVFVAVVLAALIEPLVDRLQAHKIPRAVGVIGIYVVLLLIILILARLIIPPIVSQVSSLTDNFPQFWQQTVENFESVRAYSEQQGFLDNVQRGLEGVEGSLSSAAGSSHFNGAPAMALAASLASGMPVALLANGTVREARGLASSR